MTPRSPLETTDPSEQGVRAELRDRGLEPKRTLGQNFLADTGLCKKIAALACPSEAGHVLEIGAGLGALTAPLLAAGARVTAVETDPALVAALRSKFAEQIASAQLEVLEADVRNLDLIGVLSAMPGPRTLAGNLPYHLSGLLLRRAVEASRELERCVFLLQLEVVDRLCAEAGAEAYGALSVFAQAAYSARRSFIVRRGAFYPQPSIDSAVVVLTRLAQPVPVSDAFTRVVRAAFEKRRKTLRNAWRGALGLQLAELERVASAAQIDLGARGETLSVSDFDRMARELERARQSEPDQPLQPVSPAGSDER